MNRLVALAGGRWKALRRPETRASLAAILALLVLLPAWWFASAWYGDQLLIEERAEAAQETALRASALSSAINRRLARLQGLYAFVQVELAEADLEVQFERFASGLYAGTRGILSLSVAPAGIVRYMYPLAGSENLLGYELLADSSAELRSAVQRAIDTRGFALAVLPDLTSGRLVLIGQQAVYRNDSFWGLVAISMDLSTMLDEAGLGDESGGLGYALRQAEGRLFYGPPSVFAQRPVVAEVRLADDVWQLAAAPPDGWRASSAGPLGIFRVGGLIIVGLLTGLVHLSVARQARLSDAVRERTREIARVNEQLRRDIAERRQAEAALSESEAQYRSVFESTSDGLLIYDLEGNLVDLNPVAAQMHGYSAEEFRGLRPEQYVHPTSLPLFERFLDRVRNGQEFRGRGRDLRRDGTAFDVELLGTRFTLRGQPHALAVVRDVTEQVRAYQLLEERVAERTQELGTLLDISANLASMLELEPLLELVLEQLRQVVEYQSAVIMILEGHELHSVVHQGPRREQTLAQVRLGLDDAKPLWQAMQRRTPLLIDDASGDTLLVQAFRQIMGEQVPDPAAVGGTWLGVPLLVQERLIGWLSLYQAEPGAYDSHHMALTQTIANQAAIAIENARLYAQARRVAVLEERQRLARELHDSVSQVLYGVGLGARTARALVDRERLPRDLRSQLAEPLDYVASLAEAGLAEMRALIFELRPDSLEREGLVVALARQADAVRSRHKLQVHTELCGEPELAFEAKEALLRIGQEALNNVVKHARASHVDIRLIQDDRTITLEVQDDGVGFDPQLQYPGHMGLHSMSERTRDLGAGLQIVSSLGEGALIRVRFSLAD